MLLKEQGELVSYKKQLASIINKFFINITKRLNLKEDHLKIRSGLLKGCPLVTLEDILKKFSFHPTIDKIRKTYELNKKFFSNK